MDTARPRGRDREAGDSTGKGRAAPWNSTLGRWQDEIKSTGLGVGFGKGQTPSLSQERRKIGEDRETLRWI